MYYILERNSCIFPHPESAKASGILAIGTDLSVDLLLLAYSYGIFPWYNQNEPVVWWCPDPRYVIFPSRVKVSKSMRSYFNQNKFRVTYNKAFEAVIRSCQLVPRQGQDGTWINEDIVNNYTLLHELGYVWSVEVWEGDLLVGGLYGVNLGKCFFGESMFSLRSNASKFGFISLAKKLEAENYLVIDCQQPNAHLKSLGGEFITGSVFQSIMRNNILENILKQ